MIGSANFSNAAFCQNDEVMVAITGRHPGLNDYIQHVVDTSKPIGELPTELIARSWREPRGLMHTFWNAGPGSAWLLEVIAPAGFETYFVELAEAGDPGRRKELAAKYGVTYSSDWVAGLISRYNRADAGQQAYRALSPVLARTVLLVVGFGHAGGNDLQSSRSN
jgi:phosphatidylserine/phosphatidylglycerophosphate/cardiolipin synthase-like enzyme